MGYLSNSEVTVDAILTKQGRRLLSRGKSEFKITQFALSDDEIDYSLWNPAHPNGSDSYGIAIEQLPMLEAPTDETQSMKYKLLTLPRNTNKIPVLDIANKNVELRPGANLILEPYTVNFDNGNKSLGYTAILSDTDVCQLSVVKPAEAIEYATIPKFIGDGELKNSISVIGLQFKVRYPITDIYENKTAKITFIGNETGGRITVNITTIPNQNS